MSTWRQRCGSWRAWAVALAAGCADGGGGKGGDGAVAEGGADTAPVDCAAAPLDCDGRDNDCDGVIDERGERDGRRPGTENDPCPENCRAVGDEDRDGLADCEDADCAPVCVEDCDDRRDNDLDGTLDCAGVDCGGTYSYVTTDGPHSSIGRSWVVSAWERSTTTATALGFAPLP